MKTVKNILFFLFVMLVLLTACNTNSKDDKNTITLANGEKVTYYKNNKGIITFDEWEDYNDASIKLNDIALNNYNDFDKRILDLSPKITNLSRSIPSWLQTEEVMEDIRDVNEEYRKFVREIDEPTKNVKQNLEELNEKFDDLREELVETVEDYQG